LKAYCVFDRKCVYLIKFVSCIEYEGRNVRECGLFGGILNKRDDYG